MTRRALMHRLDIALQVAIAVPSIAAAYLVATIDPQLRGWGFLIGLATQPLWFFETLRRRQWGMFLVSVFYTGAWSAGVINYYL